MKYLLVSILASWSLVAGAQPQINCDKVQGSKGYSPFLVADVVGRNLLQNLHLNGQDPVLFRNIQAGGFDVYAPDRVEGREIAPHNPFSGNQDFLIAFGSDMARLILPVELDSAVFESTVIDDKEPHANAVLILETPTHHQHARSDTIVRMLCVIKP